MNSGRKTFRRVALYLPAFQEPFWTGELYRGIRRYARADAWQLSLFTEPTPEAAQAWNPDGVIADVVSPEAAAVLSAWGKPVVGLCCPAEAGFVRIGFNDEAVGTVAAEYLLEQGFRRFGVVPVGSAPWDRDRQTGFIRRLAASGCEAIAAPVGLFTTCHRPPELSDRERAGWLERLGRGAAVFTTRDAGAFELIEACRAGELRVPEDVAVLGGGGDPGRCDITNPPLSSVRFPQEEAGYEAAEALNRLFSGGGGGERTTLSPVGVTVRGSTDAAAVQDIELAAALRYIRSNSAKRIGVGAVAAASGLSRSTLERRMQSVIGRSPLQELTRVRVELAARLLTDTQATIAEVARRSGFSKSSQLASAFARLRGCSPTAYRKRLTRPASE